MEKLKTIGFWAASLTWGLPMTIVGAIVALALLVTGHRPHRFHRMVYFVVGDGWGGFSCGCVFVVSKSSGRSTMSHEHGHGLQNVIFGIFMPFVVSIPSVIRYWYREYLVRSGKKVYDELPAYDSAWFEGQATAFGQRYFY